MVIGDLKIPHFIGRTMAVVSMLIIRAGFLIASLLLSLLSASRAEQLPFKN
jgi:hypothetical protein